MHIYVFKDGHYVSYRIDADRRRMCVINGPFVIWDAILQIINMHTASLRLGELALNTCKLECVLMDPS